MGLRQAFLTLFTVLAVVMLVVEAHGNGGGKGRDESSEEGGVGRGGHGWGNGGGWGHGGGGWGHGHHPCVWWGWWKDWRRGGGNNRAGNGFGGQDKALPLPFFFFSWLDLKFTWGCFPHGPGKPKTTVKATPTTPTTPTVQTTTPRKICPTTWLYGCNKLLDVKNYNGPLRNCSRVFSNDTIDTFIAQCIVKQCDIPPPPAGTNYRGNKTIDCETYAEFAAACNELLPEGQKLYQEGLPNVWLSVYVCPALPTTTVVQTTTSPLIPPTTTACSVPKLAQCGYMVTARDGTGFWGNCSVIGADKINAMYADCKERLCSVDRGNLTAQCIIYTEFATACEQAGGQLGDWRTTYSCPAPATTAAPAIAAAQLIAEPVVQQQIAQGAPLVDSAAAADGSAPSSSGGAADGSVQYVDWKVQKANFQRGLQQIQQIFANKQ